MAALLRLLWLVLKTNPGGLYSVLARAAAAGVLGKYVQSAYQWSLGKKTRIGMVMSLAYLIATIACSSGIHLGCDAVGWIGDLSVFMLAWGLVDASANALPPKFPTK
jgi:hypothetical protein